MIDKLRKGIFALFYLVLFPSLFLFVKDLFYTADAGKGHGILALVIVFGLWFWACICIGIVVVLNRIQSVKWNYKTAWISIPVLIILVLFITYLFFG